MSGDDLYADGWDAGYNQALVDVAAELHRVTDLAGRQQLIRLVTLLRAQAVGGWVR